MDPSILNQIKARLGEAFGDRLSGVVLYGSEARGEASPDSDIDVLVLLRERSGLWADITRCVDAVLPLSLALGRPIHAQPIAVAAWEAGLQPFLRRARAEGFVL